MSHPDKLKPSVYISPADAVLEKRPPPSDKPVEDAVVAVVPPSPRVKAVAAGCCGAVDVRTEPNVKPAPAGADEEVVAVVVREKGVADAVGLLKAKLKPVGADEVAGAPERKYIKKTMLQSIFMDSPKSYSKNIPEIHTYLM